MSIRYIGSKARVAARIADLTGAPPPGSVFVDAMVGAGSVARAVAERGWPLRINDHLASSVVTAAGRLVTTGQAPFLTWGGYPAAVAELNAAPPRGGVIHREYSPASAAVTGRERRYFTEENAARIDGIRAELGRWVRRGAVSRTEETLLLADLLRAANAVANTAGTYGCFLRDFSPLALRPLALRPRTLLATPVPVQASVQDVREVAIRADDVAYFDPPYTKRQYAAYYHLLETITHGDAPVVTGVTGLRPWRELASPFCYRRRALGAILLLLESCPSRRILLSYSDEGHVERESLVDAVGGLGVLTVHELGPVPRYRPNRAAAVRGTPSHTVTELLLELRKQPAGRDSAAASRIGSGP